MWPYVPNPGPRLCHTERVWRSAAISPYSYQTISPWRRGNSCCAHSAALLLGGCDSPSHLGPGLAIKKCRRATGWGIMAHTARYAFTARTQQRWPERPCGCQVFAHGTSARWPPSHQPPVPRPAYLQERSAQGITASISSEVLTRSCQEHPDAPCQRHRPSRPDLRTQRQPTALQTSSLPPSHAECGLGTSAAADAPTALGRRQWGMSVFGAALGAATNWGKALGW